jgi:hypothetical protein
MKTPPQKAPPRRLSPQKQQEYISRAQLVEALDGWVCNPLGEDFGEDYLVSIYDNGRSTGLTVHLQLKSTTDIQAFITKRAPDTVRYPLDVSDLEHWEDTAPPVFVVVWDVVQRKGYWQDVPSLIEGLSKTNPKWRTQKSATVPIPISNGINKAGMSDLRHRVARLLFPAIAKGKTLTIKPQFRFPKTQEGKSTLEALKRAIEYGESVTIKRENIQQFKMSSWWERLFGSAVPEAVTFSPSSTETRLPIILEAVSTDSSERIALQLKKVKAGTKLAVFENDGSDDPFKVTLTLNKDLETFSARLQYSHPHPKIHPSIVLTKFLLLAHAAPIQLVLPGVGAIGKLDFNRRELMPKARLRAWLRLLTTLARVQTRTSRYGEFIIDPTELADAPNKATRLLAMCFGAEELTTMTFSFKLGGPPHGLRKKNSDGIFSIEIDPFGDIKLFGVTVPQGKVRVDLLDIHAVEEELRAAATANRSEIRFENASVRIRYLEWALPNTGPIETAASRLLVGGAQKPEPVNGAT